MKISKKSTIKEDLALRIQKATGIVDLSVYATTGNMSEADSSETRECHLDGYLEVHQFGHRLRDPTTPAGAMRVQAGFSPSIHEQHSPLPLIAPDQQWGSPYPPHRPGHDILIEDEGVRTYIKGPTYSCKSATYMNAFMR